MKTVLVTGASSGFGRGIVSALLARDFRVIAGLRNADSRRALFEDDAARELEVVELDVTRPDHREDVARLATERGLDGIVNNAGYGLFGALEDLGETQLRAQFEVNFFGLVLLTQAVLPALRATRGFVVNVSSSLGTTALPLASAYSASKFAVEGLSEALYHELAPHGVRVHLVEPGGHRTNFASGILWGERQTPAYAAQTSAFRAFRARLASGTGTPPDAVVRAVVDLAEHSRTRLRVPVGRDAVATAALRAVLPDRFALPALRLAFGRILAASGKAGTVE